MYVNSEGDAVANAVIDEYGYKSSFCGTHFDIVFCTAVVRPVATCAAENGGCGTDCTLRQSDHAQCGERVGGVRSCSGSKRRVHGTIEMMRGSQTAKFLSISRDADLYCLCMVRIKPVLAMSIRSISLLFV